MRHPLQGLAGRRPENARRLLVESARGVVVDEVGRAQRQLTPVCRLQLRGEVRHVDGLEVDGVWDCRTFAGSRRGVPRVRSATECRECLSLGNGWEEGYRQRQEDGCKVGHGLERHHFVCVVVVRSWTVLVWSFAFQEVRFEGTLQDEKRIIKPWVCIYLIEKVSYR